MLSALGSLASIFGLFVSLYVLWRELRIQKDVETLQHDEEMWHKNQNS